MEDENFLKQISVEISKGCEETCSFKIDIKGNTMEILIESIEEAKSKTNQFLTKLVEEQKLESKSITSTQKLHVSESLNDDEEEETDDNLPKRLKTDETVL